MMAENKKKENPEVEETLDEDIKAEETANEEADAQKSEVEKLKEDYAGMYDKYVRLVAEFDNFKKRSVKEKADIYSAAKIDVIEKLLPVIDNLERAELYSEPEKVLEGLQLIIKQFREYLEKLDIHEIEAQDCEFNPELHNAVMHEDSEDAPQNTVIEVFQKGYTVGDKLLRPAMVKVVN